MTFFIRAEQMLTLEKQKTDRSSSNGSVLSTGTLLRKKMSLGRRSKSLTKNNVDEATLVGQESFTFPAYEKVRLRHPGFLRFRLKMFDLIF